jgi:hypothetical protein
MSCFISHRYCANLGNNFLMNLVIDKSAVIFTEREIVIRLHIRTCNYRKTVSFVRSGSDIILPLYDTKSLYQPTISAKISDEQQNNRHVRLLCTKNKENHL